MDRFEKMNHMMQSAGLALEFKGDSPEGILGVWDGYCKDPAVTFQKFNGPDQPSFVTAWTCVRNGEFDDHSFAGVSFTPFYEGLKTGKETRVKNMREQAGTDISAMAEVKREEGIG